MKKRAGLQFVLQAFLSNSHSVSLEFSVFLTYFYMLRAKKVVAFDAEGYYIKYYVMAVWQLLNVRFEVIGEC